MESAIATLIVVSVIVLSVYLANYTKDSSSDSKSQKMNDIYTFTLPFIATLVIGIAVITDFIYLPLAITAALIAGVLSLLVSWTEEKKQKEARQKKNNLFIMQIFCVCIPYLTAANYGYNCFFFLAILLPFYYLFCFSLLYCCFSLQ